MTAKFIQEIKDDIVALYNKFQDNPVVHEAEIKAKAIGSSSLTYIETNALHDFYQICLALLAGAATGTPWATLGATAVAQGEAAGIAIAKGAESIVLAQAQADLIAAGTIVAPTTGAVVTSTPAVASPAAAESGS